MRRTAFTLVELLVVIAIIAVIMAMFLPALSKAKDTSKRSRCQAALHGIGICASAYAGDYKGYLPTGDYTVDYAHNTVSARLEAACTGQAFAPDHQYYEAGSLIFGGYTKPNQIWCPSRIADQAAQSVMPASRAATTWYMGTGGAYYRVGYDFRNEGSKSTVRYLSTDRDPDMNAKPYVWDDVSGRISTTTGTMTRYGHPDGYNVLYGGMQIRWVPDPKWTAMYTQDSGTAYYFGTQRDLFVVNFLDKQ